MGCPKRCKAWLALGYTDLAVSAMLTEIIKEVDVTTTPSPEHRCRCIVSLTPHGEELTAQARAFLGEHYARLMQTAQVDAQHYTAPTEQIYQTLMTKEKSGYESE